MPDETDGKKILTVSLEELEETSTTPSYYAVEHYPSRTKIQ